MFQVLYAYINIILKVFSLFSKITFKNLYFQFLFNRTFQDPWYVNPHLPYSPSTSPAEILEFHEETYLLAVLTDLFSLHWAHNIWFYYPLQLCTCNGCSIPGLMRNSTPPWLRRLRCFSLNPRVASLSPACDKRKVI